MTWKFDGVKEYARFWKLKIISVIEKMFVEKEMFFIEKRCVSD